MATASKETMELLHETLAQTLLTRLRGGDDISASDLNVIRQFLKDNNIDAQPKPGSTMASIVESLPYDEDPEDENIVRFGRP